MWRSLARAGGLLRVCAAVLALAGVNATLADPPYRLIGQQAPDFALRAVSGVNARVSEHRGEVVVLSFWSSRCTPCRTQLSMLNRSFVTYQSAGLAMFGVGVDDDPKRALEFAHSAGVGFPMLLDPEKGVARSYEVDNPDAVVALMGLTGIPFTDVYNGCATAASALTLAANTIRLGDSDLGIAVGMDKHIPGAFTASM